MCLVLVRVQLLSKLKLSDGLVVLKRRLSAGRELNLNSDLLRFFNLPHSRRTGGRNLSCSNGATLQKWGLIKTWSSHPCGTVNGWFQGERVICKAVRLRVAEDGCRMSRGTDNVGGGGQMQPVKLLHIQRFP